MLTPVQIAHFETFGFLALRGALLEDIVWITDEFERAWIDRPDVVHSGGERTMFPANFVSTRPRLTSLMDHPVMTGALDDLIGAGWKTYGGDGNFYSGDTAWHADCGPDQVEPKSITRHVKVAFYLDHLTRDTGALRVIPGSHHAGDRFREMMAGVHGGEIGQMRGQDLPAVALEVVPGDLLLFDHRLYHASFGGGRRRRMFTQNVFAPTPDARTREAAMTVMRHYRDREKVHWVFDPAWLAAMSAGCRSRLPLDLCAELVAEVAQQPALAGR